MRTACLENAPLNEHDQAFLLLAAQSSKQTLAKPLNTSGPNRQGNLFDVMFANSPDVAVREIYRHTAMIVVRSLNAALSFAAIPGPGRFALSFAASRAYLSATKNSPSVASWAYAAKVSPCATQRATAEVTPRAVPICDRQPACLSFSAGWR